MTARATAARLASSVPLVWVARAALMLLAIGLTLHHPTTPIPSNVRREMDNLKDGLKDTLKASRPKDSGSIASLKTFAAAAQERGHAAAVHAEGVVTRSRSDAHDAASLAADARTQALKPDSAVRVAELYRQAYESRTMEALELEKAILALREAHREDSTAIALGKGALLITATRLAAFEQVVEQVIEGGFG